MTNQEANMSLHARPAYPVPEKTAETARAIFPDGNLYMKLFDTFGSVFSDRDFAPLFPANGQPAFSPVRLMLVLILQFIEGLSDRQAHLASPDWWADDSFGPDCHSAPPSQAGSDAATTPGRRLTSYPEYVASFHPPFPND